MGDACLVTGVAGFIGSSLARALLGEGRAVIGIDAFDDNYDRRIKEWNLEGLRGSESFHWVPGDLMEVDLLPLLDQADVVFHLAARPGVRESWGEAYEVYNRQNVLVTQRLLDACTRQPPSRLVYASSSSIYGEMPGHPVREDESPKPISPYGVTKLAGEHLVMAYHRSHGIPAVSLRYFTVYGPRQRPDMAFHRFLRAIHSGGEITLYGDGSQTRDVTYVDDVVSANLAAMTRGRPGSAYNVGGGHRVSINDALEVMQETTGRKATIRREPRPAGDPVNTGADMALTRRELSFEPRTSLREGIGHMSRWMEACLERGL